jgi:tetratricopeptide (TPR) repeat protein
MLSRLRENKLFLLGLLLVGALAVALFLPKMSLERRLLTSGKLLRENKEFAEAVAEFERAVRYSPSSWVGLESARLGGVVSLYDLKDYEKAVFFFRHIVRFGQKPPEVKWAQQRLAEIYYEKLSNYPQAIVEYQRLLQANPAKEEAPEYQLRIARSYFYMANFDQAISEANEFISKNPSGKYVYEMHLLKADALLAQKKLDEAIAAYTLIEEMFKDREDVTQVRLNKAIAFEDKKDWDRAIAVLEGIKEKYPHPDVIALKIKSILRRKARKKEL